jgi:beta-carotene hydroxylase
MTATVLPALDSLGDDLVAITPFRRRLALARPFAYLGAYGAAAATGHWVLALVALFLLFCADISLMHDAVHGTLGLRRRGTDWTLFGAGALLLVSGHAYRRTHQQHHKVFPGPDDPEGEAARLTPLQCLLDGPLHVPRIWLWAFRRAPRRGWLVAEALVPFAGLAGGVAILPWTPALLVYASLVIAGGWLYPLLTVYLPHHHYGDEPVKQARTLRGRILPTLLLEQTYHLEHHLYPRVPSHKLPELARRLDPHLRDAGVNPRRVP